MAKVYPERLPESVFNDPKRQAECKVYLALKNLPEKYNVYYSTHWENPHDEWGMREGEVDFIVTHPDMGILFLEVKGGGIRYDAVSDQWFSHSAGGNVYPIKDPVEQGRRNQYALRDQLRLLPSWPAGDINIGHAVCFPDINTYGKRLKPDLPPESIIDRTDLDDISSAILRLFTALFGRNIGTGGAPGRQRVQILENYLKRSFELKTPLGVEIEYEDQKLVQLTEQQFYALSFLGERKRVAIGGCAGSGKTMLALEKARQFSELGMNVLLTCFNSPLSVYLKARLPNVHVYNFHELCRQAASEAGIRILERESDPAYFDNYLPETLLKAADEIGRIYDTIIVDEGQDFKESYWIALESLLKNQGYLYIFFDDNQNIYAGTPDFGGLITESVFRLTLNCRNTQAIHRVVVRFHNNPDGLLCPGPAGRPPELLPYRGEEDGLRQLQKLLHRLVVEENIHPADISILTPRGRETTRLKANTQLGNFRLSPYPSSERNVIHATSVYLFKGLEKRVIILTEIDSRTTYNPSMVMYVGCSRARTHLAILHDESAPQVILTHFTA